MHTHTHVIRYFQSVLTKEYFVDRQLVIIKSITGDSLDDMVGKNLITEAKDPDVEDIIKVNGMRNIYPAVVRYKDMNGCTTADANEAVYEMAKKLNPPKNIKKPIHSKEV